MATLPAPPAFDYCAEDAKPRRDQRWRVAEAAPGEAQGQEGLSRLVEGEIIPRLMLAYRSAPAADFTPRGGQPAYLGPETIEQFSRLALDASAEALLAYVGNLLQHGVAMEAVFLDLLAPSARLLGAMWTDDRVSYADVTIALGRLKHVVHELSLHGPAMEGHAPQGRSALFAPAPGEQHTFGLSIVEELFRRAGWRTWMEPEGLPHEVIQAASSHHFDIFAVSIACADRIDALKPLIASVRQASRNPDISVFVGGRLLQERPDLAEEVGADQVTTDAKQAVLLAEGAVRQSAQS